MAKKYSDSFKIQAVNRVLNDNIKVKNVSNKLYIPIQTLYRWISIYKDEGIFHGSGNPKNNDTQKLQKIKIENDILKKALHLSEDKTNIFDFIYEHKHNYPVQTMCRLLGVSSSGYYKYSKDITSLQELRHRQITRLVRDVYIERGPNISGPKITAIINKNKNIASQATVSRIIERNKDYWHTNHSKFHNNKDVVLHFENKDTLYDIHKQKYYNEQFAKSEIQSLFNTTSLSQLIRHDGSNSSEVYNFSVKDNLLIQGDNLLALHKIKDTFKQKVKLIYIDVPFNTRRSDLSYSDYYSRPDYLLFLKNRLEIAKQFLKINGSIFIHCNDKEQAYIKVLSDEVFGEENFINQIIWKRSTGQQNRSHIANTKDYILVYAKNKNRVRLNGTALSPIQLKSYKYNDSKGKFRLDRILNKNNGYYKYEIISPCGQSINNRWNYSFDTFESLQDNEMIYWSMNDVPYKKVYLKNSSTTIVNDLWIENDTGTTQEGTAELQSILGNNNFTYPKPEKLLKRIIELSTNENDLVLDFFAGSGTTAAVAFKLNRQFIAIELIEENFNLIVDRLQKTLHNNKNTTVKDKLNLKQNSFISFKLN